MTKRTPQAEARRIREGFQAICRDMIRERNAACQFGGARRIQEALELSGDLSDASWLKLGEIIRAVKA